MSLKPFHITSRGYEKWEGQGDIVGERYLAVAFAAEKKNEKKKGHKQQGAVWAQ